MKQNLQQQLTACTIRDRARLKSRLDAIDWTDKKAVKRLQQSIGRAKKYRSERAAGIPAVDLHGGLPIHACIREIETALSENQVIIVCGETGSGKTTQLPGLCLAMGRGVDGVIGHTQPRRIAARTVAARIREELNVRNNTVAYKVRHTDTTAPETCIKVMTDGILLAELQSDHRLFQYDTLIIDEAHERSLNIDFLLGYIRQLLPARPELKVIITSATIDVDRFSRHFDDAPVVEVSGRTYPVEVRYRPPGIDETDDNPEERALLGAIDELNREGRGDILIFLEGEREIHETARLLGKQNYPGTDILPLYSRLSSARQSAIFRSHKRRHIILATNVAETSLTIPGIHYVIDRGYARISRYSRRSKVQRLPTEKISRASAEQRKGRCGRVAEGICIRLYSEDDYLARPEFTDPEILRTNLASVILQMKSLGLGEITSFPFIDNPDRRYVNDGIRLLHELSALDGKDELTPVGKKLARLPVDPRLGRILLAAGERACLPEGLIIVSALSIQDPRERPLDAQERADEAHAQFNDERSDFVWFLNLWDFYRKHKAGMSRNRLRKLCKQHFLSPVRMREWEDIHKQLSAMVKEPGMKLSSGSADYNNLHCALVTGFPGQIACRTGKHEYTGARDLRLYIFPGSSQAGRQPKWIVAAELVETSRLFARTVAQIDPRWLVKIVPHLVQREHYEPHWESGTGQVLCYEKVTLYGLTLSANRKVNYGKVDDTGARQLFIREALVEDGPDYDIDFLGHNRNVIAEIHRLEDRARRRDLLDEAALQEFYDKAIPARVHNIPLLKEWLKKNPGAAKSLLLERDSIMNRPEEAESLEQYPDTLTVNEHRLPIEYHFEPGQDNDGIVVNVPLHLLNQLNAAGLDQLVPGMFREKITAMLKSLPREYRRKLVPVPDTADECVRALENSSGQLATNLSDYLFRSRGLEISPDKFNTGSLPDHLKIKLLIIDKQGNVIDEGRDLHRLKREHGISARNEFSQTYAGGFDRDGLTDWDFDEIPGSVSIDAGGKQVRVYPALVDEHDSVALRCFDTRGSADSHMREGLRRLLMLSLKKDIRCLIKHLLHIDRMCLWYAPAGSCESLKQDLVELVVDQVFLEGQPPVRNRAEFAQRKEDGVKDLFNTANRICDLVYDILKKYNSVRSELESLDPEQPARLDMEEQLDFLVYSNFLIKTDFYWLGNYPRYLDAIARRIEKLSHDPSRDEKQFADIRPYWDTCKKLMLNSRQSGNRSEEFMKFRWMVEEYRVSLFAQEQKTVIPVSGKRLRTQLDNIKSEVPVHNAGHFA